MSDDHHGRLSRQGPAILGLVALLALLRWTLGFPPSEPQKPDQKTKAASPSQPHVSLANFRRIKRGMSVAQVEAIFGTPGEDGPGGEGERPYSWRGSERCGSLLPDRRRQGYVRLFFFVFRKKQYWLPRDE